MARENAHGYLFDWKSSIAKGRELYLKSKNEDIKNACDRALQNIKGVIEKGEGTTPLHTDFRLCPQYSRVIWDFKSLGLKVNEPRHFTFCGRKVPVDEFEYNIEENSVTFSESSSDE
jgi:hypothetical protein